MYLKSKASPIWLFWHTFFCENVPLTLHNIYINLEICRSLFIHIVIVIRVIIYSYLGKF
jgi:hypothetical protein